MWQGRAAENAASRMLGFVGVRAAIDDGVVDLCQKVHEETDVFTANLVRVCSEVFRFARRWKPWCTMSACCALTSALTCALVTRASLGRVNLPQVSGPFRPISALRTVLRTDFLRTRHSVETTPGNHRLETSGKLSFNRPFTRTPFTRLGLAYAFSAVEDPLGGLVMCGADRNKSRQ